MCQMRHRQKQSGVALLLVLILVVSATILGVSYATSTTVKLISTDNLLRAGRSRYLAESGVEHGLHLLRSDPDVLAGSASTLLGPFNADGTSDGYYLGSAAVADQIRQYVLTGRATSGGITQTVTTRVYLENRYKALIDSLGPTHYFRLSEQPVTTVAVDEAGEWDGKYKDNTSRGWPGALMYDDNLSAHLDGFNDRILLDDGSGGNVDLEGDKMTIVAWIWPDTHNHLTEHDARIISKANGLFAADHWWMIGTYKSGSYTRLRFCLKTNGVTTVLNADQGDVPLNTWTMVTVTYDGSWMRIFQDGVLVGQCAKTGAIDEDDTVEAWVGGNPSHAKDRPWHGRIDEVAIFARSLTAAEIMTIYKARLPNVDRLAWNE